MPTSICSAINFVSHPIAKDLYLGDVTFRPLMPLKCDIVKLLALPKFSIYYIIAASRARAARA